MRTITLRDIRKCEPCHDPSIYVKENWKGTVIDIIEHPSVRPEHKIWIVSRLVKPVTSRMFAVWCTRKALKLVENVDPVFNEACDVAERYALGQVSYKQLYQTEQNIARKFLSTVMGDDTLILALNTVQHCIRNHDSEAATSASSFHANAYASKRCKIGYRNHSEMYDARLKHMRKVQLMAYKDIAKRYED